ncbi:hypothetical protein AE618_19160 [Bosea vaviloviae]|uniref:Uncharacterized protein n=2 Tax=Bosea vaviloviae TaxID=1526658 RepID=A0A0N0MAA8_9HYPH|nr:hypothetical protein AE618_19160 [Bosea vaviloviae]
MRRLRFAVIVMALLSGADGGAAASGAQCELKGSFDGTPVPGAAAVGTVRTGSPLGLDPFGANATHKVLISLTSTTTGTSLSVSLGDVQGKSELFLETGLGATTLTKTVDGDYGGRKIIDMSLLCIAAP